MKLRILAPGLVIGTLLVFATGCDIIYDLINPPPPASGVLFLDDFEDGADPAWSAASGTWIVRGGRYTIEEGDSVWFNTYVKTNGSRFWRNYAVEVDVFDATAGWQGGIIVRAQDDRNKVMLRFQHDHNLSLNIWIDGRSRRCEDAIVHPGLTAKAHIRVEAVGNRYTAYVRQGDEGELIKRVWCEDETFTQGMPGLALYNKDWQSWLGEPAYDNFKVISLGG